MDLFFTMLVPLTIGAIALYAAEGFAPAYRYRYWTR